MANIYFIRHGQASFLKTDYDQLSDLGLAQAKALGQYWSRTGQPVDQIFSGQLKRQIQTAQAFLEGAGTYYPICTDAGFDEHHGPEIVKPYYPDKFALEQEVLESDFEAVRRNFYGTYFKLAIPWVRNELDSKLIGHLESWGAFRRRFSESFEALLDGCPRGGIFLSLLPADQSVLRLVMLLISMMRKHCSWVGR